MTFINDVLWITGFAWWLVVSLAGLMTLVLWRNRRRLKQVHNELTISMPWVQPSDGPLTDNRYGRSGPDVV